MIASLPHSRRARPRRLSLAVLGLTALGLGFGATRQVAAEPTVAHLRPYAPRQARVIHRYGHDFVVAKRCDGPPDLPRKMVPYADGVPDLRLKVFLNFDGQTLTQGKSNAQANTTGLITAPTLDYPAMVWGSYGGRDKGIKDVLEELKLLYGDVAVEFVTERPADGDYTMVMVGGQGVGIGNTGPTGSTVGIAPLDCKNSNKNDVATVFGNKITPSPKNLAYVIAHELGHTFGLEHVDDDTDIMYPQLNGNTCCWTDSNLAEPPGTCGRAKQDSKGVLIENVGAGPGDTVPPKIWFVRPGAGAVLPGNFVFEVTAGDDLRVHHVTLFFDGKEVASLALPPYVARVTGATDGVHKLSAEVYDWKPNVVKAEHEVTIDSKCVLDGRCNGGVPGVGAECQSGADCGTGVCTLVGGLGVCAQACSAATDICPEGMTCREAGANWGCVKETVTDGFTFDVSKGSGGCAVPTRAPATSTPWLLLLLLGFVALLGRRRRR